MADISSITLPGGGTYDLKDKNAVPKYGMGKNLLDNAYFVGGGSQLGDGIFPINQRGQTSYSGAGYCIDRWSFANSFSCTLELNGLRLTPNNQSNRQCIQGVENAQQYAGKTLTLSVMILENTATPLFFQVFGITKDPGVGFTGLYSTAITAPDTISDPTVKIRFNPNGADAGNALISAIKLELGTEQTLCHNEGTADAPVWVLNEIPDYGEELRKCQRHYLRFRNLYGSYYRFGFVNAYSATVGMAVVPTPVSMKTPVNAPTMRQSGVRLQSGNSAYSLTGVTFQGIGPNAIYLDVSVGSGLSAGGNYLLVADSGYLEIEVD